MPKLNPIGPIDVYCHVCHIYCREYQYLYYTYRRNKAMMSTIYSGMFETLFTCCTMFCMKIRKIISSYGIIYGNYKITFFRYMVNPIRRTEDWIRMRERERKKKMYVTIEVLYPAVNRYLAQFCLIHLCNNRKFTQFSNIKLDSMDPYSI